MSILESPRLHFRGRISWDPIVTNNTQPFYDEATAQASIRPGETAEQFRQTAIGAVSTKGGNWNVDGTHRSMFFDTKVSSVNMGCGTDTNDVFVGQPISFAGMLVDAEPYGSFSSQLFFDEMGFGIDGGARILGRRRTRMHARRIFFGRNLNYHFTAGGASVMWQTTFAKSDGLVVDAHDSTFLNTLRKKLDEDDVLGLTVRWNAYRTIYFNTPGMSDPAVAQQQFAALQAKLKLGGFQPNPAVSELVGALGLWRKGEPSEVGGDRFLVPAAKSPLGNAYARVESTRVVIDLQNSVPENDLDLVKHDYGSFDVVALGNDAHPEETPLGTLDYSDYDEAAYELTGGIVEVPRSDGQDLSERDIVLRKKGTKDALLTETSLYACPQAPNTYVTEGETSKMQVIVLQRGAPKAGATVHKTRISASCETTSSTTDASGVATVELTGEEGGGVSQFFLTVDDQEVPAGLTGSTVVSTPYCFVRSLPKDDEVAALAPTWPNVYQNVLINWHAMAPCMDNWLDLGSEERVGRMAKVLRKLTAPDAFEQFRFMPVTRDITKGERTLLYAWLDRVEQGASDLEPKATLARASRKLNQDFE